MLTNLIKIIKNCIFLAAIISLAVSCKKEQVQIKTIKGQLIKIDSTLVSDSSIVKVVQPYKKELQNEINQVLSYTPVTLTRKDGELQSSLGNIYADLCMNKANPLFHDLAKKEIDFALFNYGGIRQSISKGTIKVGDIFKLMPFENMLVVAELSGEKVSALFEYFEKKKSAHPISGVNMTFKGDSIQKIIIQGKPFDKSKNYFVLTSDYLQHGGDHMVFFKDPINLYGLNYKVRDAIIDYLKENDTINVSLDNRIIIE